MFLSHWFLVGFLLFTIIINKCQANVGIINSTFFEEDKNKVADDSKITAHDETNSLSIEQLQKAAHFSYLDEDYASCVQLFEQTRKRYRAYQKGIINCRKKCQDEANNAMSMFTHFVGEMIFYEKKIKETLCLMKCHDAYEIKNGKGSLTLLSPKLEHLFSDLHDYSYIHICYYQLKKYNDAANAIFTYLVLHPNDRMSLKYMDHYLTNPDVTKNTLKDLEAAAYIDLYEDAVKEYENNNYLNAIDGFEHSLDMYFENDNDCRLYCEGPFDQGWHSELVVSLANHYTYSLQCKQNCTRWLNTINGQHQSDVLANHYHYLQFAYYKVGLLADACSATESYMLFYPADETMISNKQYYAALPKFKEEYFVPRQEAIRYIKRQTSEFMLLQFISEEFKIKSKNNSDSKVSSNDFESLEKAFTVLPEQFVKIKNDDARSDILKADMIVESRKEFQITITAAESDLGGKSRYVAEGLFNQTECDSIIKLANIAVVEGDGYVNSKSPHSRFEKFEGASIGRLAVLAYFGIIDPRPIELLLDVTETIQNHVKKYFNISDNLYVTFTHLTKRSPLSQDSPKIRDDLSHAIHADNCIFNNEECVRKSPAYTWRDYSAILYLNDNMMGGEFIFTHDRSLKTIEASVQPRCGRMVAFTSDQTNLHAVRGILLGDRFAIAMWFTLQDKYFEFERILARAVLQRVYRYGSVQAKAIEHIPKYHEPMLTSIFYNDSILQHLLQY